MWTMGRRRNDALPQGHAVDADIEEAAHNTTEHKKDHRPEMERHGGPVMRIKNCVHHRADRAKYSRAVDAPGLGLGTVLGIDILFKRLAHDLKRRRTSTPDFQSARTLMQQHADAVGSAAASFARGLEQRPPESHNEPLPSWSLLEPVMTTLRESWRSHFCAAGSWTASGSIIPTASPTRRST